MPQGACLEIDSGVPHSKHPTTNSFINWYTLRNMRFFRLFFFFANNSSGYLEYSPVRCAKAGKSESEGKNKQKKMERWELCICDEMCKC